MATIYLEIPSEYECIYKKLLEDLSSIGVKGLQECTNIPLLDRETTLVLESWNMFQIACAAFKLEEFEKADKIVMFIDYRMNYCCKLVPRFYGNPTYYGAVTETPAVDSIIVGSFSENKTFNFNVPTTGHYLAIPDGTVLRSVENASFRGDWLYNSSLSIDLYTKTNIVIDSINYVLWYCEFPVAFNSRVEVKLV